MHRFVLSVLCCVMALAGAPASLAQAYPVKPLRIIIAFAPGGPSDVMGRVVADRLSKAFGVQAIPDNRPGAGGNIGVRLCAKSPPDGYTLCTITVAQAVAPSVYKNLGYDLIADFAHVTLVATLPSLLTAHPSLPVTNVRELIAFARTRPGQLSFSSAGNGTSPHMMMELFNWMAGLKMVHIAYKGLAMAVVDQISGEIPVAFNTAITVVPHIKSGKLRALATSSQERFPLLPDLPSVDEGGLQGFEGSSWQGLVMPAHTPPEIVTKVHAALAVVLKSADTREKFLAQGALPSGLEPGEFAAFVRRETEKWAKVANAARIRAE